MVDGFSTNKKKRRLLQLPSFVLSGCVKCRFRFLPLRLLGTVGSPLGGSGSTRGGPVLTGSTVPTASGGGTAEGTRGGGLPVTTGVGETGLDSSLTGLVGASGLLLLDLLLGLLFRVAVCVMLVGGLFFLTGRVWPMCQ